MELKLISEKAATSPAGTMSATDDIFARDFNEALIHQLVVAYENNGAARHQRAEGPRRSRHVDQEALAPEGHGRARAPA